MYRFSKRILDVVVSFLALTFFLPLMIVISVMVKTSSAGPIFYKAPRAGYKNSSFMIIKFRTMVDNADRLGGPSTALDDKRLTSIGRSLRRYKLDELPQFFNVLMGHMSLVGPRPQVLYYTDKYQGELLDILSVRPGITDLSSLFFSDMDAILGQEDVDNRYEKEIEPIKNRLRLQYVREATFLLDLRILVETAFSILGVRNITGLNIK